MIFWSLCAFIWLKKIEKMLLQMTSGFLQLESTIQVSQNSGIPNHFGSPNMEIKKKTGLPHKDTYIFV
jgi:hypothetical protein